MSNPPPGKDEEKFARAASAVRVMAMATMIPTLMVVAPLVGWFLGRWIGQWTGYPSIGGSAGLLLGLLAGGRQVYVITRRIIQESKGSDRQP